MLNKVTLIGNVGKDPDERQFDNFNVANFTIATSEKYKDRSGETKTLTEWHNCSATNQLAGIVMRYVKKGMLVYVEGKITTRSYEDRDGNKKYITEIRVSELKMLSKSEQPAPTNEAHTPTTGNNNLPASESSDLSF